MNIFVLHDDPREAARLHCDKHVVKMPLETAQILSTVLLAAGAYSFAFYKPTHPRHPCTLWAGETRANARWLLALGLELVAEHGRRYPHTKAGCEGHKAGPVLRACARHIELLPEGELTPHAQCMPEHLRGPSAVEAYRRFYVEDKARFATWRAPSTRPGWMP